MTSLPIDDYLQKIRVGLAENSYLILSAAPGAGKTTRVPPALMKMTEEKVIVLEPRRMAAVAACHRIAEEQNWTVGNEVGYQVRFEKKFATDTKLIFMTEALLARKMLEDPELKGIGIVVIDEFHERSASTDLTLSLLKELISLGSNIKVLIMSATLQSQEISAYLGEAKIFEVPGKLFPLQVQKQKNPQVIKTDKFFYDSMKDKIKFCLGKTKNDILVFLPGTGEIRRLENILNEENWANHCAILPLHGRLPLDAQRLVLQKNSQQKIILSTNVAESSVTIDGVDTVIDCGLEKSSTWDYRTGFNRLELQRISLSSAQQRAGRCARQMPGYCEQLWSATDELSMTKERIPEIQRMDPSEILIFLSHHGIRNFESFDWFQKPDAKKIAVSIQRLQLLGIFQSDHSLTDLGKKIIHWPLAPEIGVLLAHFESIGQVELGCAIVSLMQEPDFVSVNPKLYPQDLAKESDLDFRLRILNDEIRLERSELNFSGLQKVKESISSLKNIFSKKVFSSGKEQKSSGSANNSFASVKNKSSIFLDEKAMKLEILKSWPHRLCRRRKNSNKGLCFDGHGVQISDSSFAINSDFFLILSGIDGALSTETLVTAAIGYSKEEVLKTLPHLLQNSEELKFIEDKEEVLLASERKIGAISLEEPKYKTLTENELQDYLPRIALARWETWIQGNEDLSSLTLRLHFLIHNKDYVTEDLKNIIEDFSLNEWKEKSLHEAAYNESSYKNLISKNMNSYFRQNLPWEIQNALENEVPEKLPVPSGKSYKIDYQNLESPALHVRLQEVFGWKTNPSVLFQKIKIKLYLLGPNFRPAQITNDLASFWQNTYHEVKKELRTRYPKHSWPDNPLEAIAIAGPLKRKR